jgi:hypothetical protein
MSYVDIKQVKIQNTDSEQINPVQDETVVLLRKLLHLASSLAVTDASQRQRVVVESNANISTVSTVSNLATMAGVDTRQHFQDMGRNMFANAIRSKLEFS